MVLNNNHIEKKTLSRIALTYGLITAFTNFVGFLLASSGGMPIAESSNYQDWSVFMTEHAFLVNILSILSFVTPTILIVQYRWRLNTNTITRIINIPFIYSAFGCLGWILSFFMEFVCLMLAKTQYNINVSEIATISLLNILQESICIFTLTFLILNYIHRKIVLPKLFPRGNLSKYNIPMNPSVRFIVIVFYLSICVFPMFFLTSALVSVIRNNHVSIKPTIFVVLGFIIVFSVVILWTFCNYFTDPLAKLKEGTLHIQSGDYEHHVDIVSSDEFGELGDAFNEMSNSLAEKNKRIHDIQNSIIKGMAVMVESRDNSTGGHISRTSDCVRVFVNKLTKTDSYANLSPDFCKAVIKAAPMHDLGKIAVDDAVLRKPGKFTDEEYEIMKTHSAEGARIVESVLSQVDDENFKRVAINVAHFHHEKWNGAGYPTNISGEDIPLEARIMALADVFDALVSKRCYKESFTYDKAFQIIEESLGSHFDPELGRIFITCRPELEALYNSYS